jgi:hypothetical protein
MDTSNEKEPNKSVHVSQTEKELLSLLKSISESLKDIKTEISEVAVAVRESNSFDLDEEEECDGDCGDSCKCHK